MAWAQGSAKKHSPQRKEDERLGGRALSSCVWRMLLRLESQKSEPTSIPMSFVLLDKYGSFFLSASPTGSSWSKQKYYPCPMSTGSSWFPFPPTKPTSNIEHVEREARIKIQCHYFDLLLCPNKDRNSQKDYIEVIYWKRYAELIVSLGVPVVVLQERSRYCNIAFKSQLSLDMLYVCWVAGKGNRLLRVMIGHEEEFSVVFILELLDEERKWFSSESTNDIVTEVGSGHQFGATLFNVLKKEF